MKNRNQLLLNFPLDKGAQDYTAWKTTGAPTFCHGRRGACVVLDGRSALETPLDPKALGDNFTVECWFKPHKLAGPEPSGEWAAPWRIVGLAVFERVTGSFYFRLQCFGKALPLCWPGRAFRSTLLQPERWHHIAAVFTPHSTGWYVNGVPVEVVPEGQDFSVQEGKLRLGVGFEGCLEGFRIWRGALQSREFEVPETERPAAFARQARLRAWPADVTKGTGVYAIGLEPLYVETAPADIAEIPVALTAEPIESLKTQTMDLGALVLKKSSKFQTRVDFTKKLPPGLYQATCRATVRLASPVEMVPKLFSLKVPAPLAQVMSTRGTSRLNRPALGTQVMRLDGPAWSIDIDPENEGREKGWTKGPRPSAKPTRVPWSMQERFPGYHGVAWYWRTFTPGRNPHRGGKYWLRFHAVDYWGEVWVNGRYVGGHRGGETPFDLDATAAIEPGRKNMLAVRVLNPYDKPVDGLMLWHTAKAPKWLSVGPNSTYNAGGIVGAVELRATPVVRIENVHVVPDYATGEVAVEVSLHNAGTKSLTGTVTLSVISGGKGSELLAEKTLQVRVPAGASRVRRTLRLREYLLWSPDDPHLYHLTVNVSATGSPSSDQWTVRFGFRDFRYAKGYFWLNGKRIFLNGAMHCPEYPALFVMPHDADLARRDIVMMKAMGLNFCRVAFGSLTPGQLDLCDELGLLVLQAHRGDWQLDWKIREWPGMEKEFARSIAEVVRRDWNHPSVAIWDWMNETIDGRLFRYATADLQFLRQLDPHRMVLLNSGRTDMAIGIGDLSNPGSWTWDGFVSDSHSYPPIPHTTWISTALRTAPDKPFIVTEYSTCGALDVPRLLRHLEQRGLEHGDDATYYRELFEHFMKDWRRWRLNECWVRPEDFFDQSHRTVATLRLMSGNEVRANPHLIGHSMWNSLVDLHQGCGSLNIFREMKPGNAEPLWDIGAPLRWCLFAEPSNVYRGGTVRLDAVLSNLDVLKPGEYPARVQVVGPEMKRLLDETIMVRIPGPERGRLPPFAFTAFSRDLVVDGPAGPYRFIVNFERGGAASGGPAEFHVLDAADMPAISADIALFGEDAELTAWLGRNQLRVYSFDPARPPRDVILAVKLPNSGEDGSALAELIRHVNEGATAVILTPDFFAGLDKQKNLGNIAGLDPNLFYDLRGGANRLPLIGKGRLTTMSEVGGYYRPDDWARRHPIFDGLPCGGIMDYVVYREILPQEAFADLEHAEEAVAGAIRVGGGGLQTSYMSGLHVSVHRLGAGHVILNTLKIRQNLGKDPVAERLLRNMLNYAARLCARPRSNE